MAKKTNKPRGTAFSGPAIGKRVPGGTKFKQNADGSITPIKPKTKKK